LKFRIGIVGGSGFIGASLSHHLIRDFQIRVLDKNPVAWNLTGKVDYANCDITNYEEVANHLDNLDLVVHTAIIQMPLINERKRLSYEVNVVGTQNVCRVVDENPGIKGMILTSSWHTMGENGLRGLIDEEFGFRPDKVEERARLYAISKIAQETIVRFYDEMSDKIFGIIRMGTVLGEGMPEKTVANIFINNGLEGKPLTPYLHSMYRPMLYVDLEDICRAFQIYTKKILFDRVKNEGNSLAHIINVYYPKPITVLELAKMVKENIAKCTNGKFNPEIEIVDKGIPSPFTEDDAKRIKVDISRAKEFLGLTELKSTDQSIERIIKQRINCRD